MQAIDIGAVAAAFGNGLNFDTQPCLFPTLYKWLEHVPDAYSNAEQQARLSLHSVSFTCSPKYTGMLDLVWALSIQSYMVTFLAFEVE